MSRADTDDTSDVPNIDEQEPSAVEESVGCPFGPAFFLGRLAAFARDRCPNPQEHLPTVEIHLADGDVLHVCHIIGLAPRWVALAVFDREDAVPRPPPMRTELVPYAIVTRITIRSVRREASHLGFEAGERPQLWKVAESGHSAEEALQAAARPLVGEPPQENHCAKDGE